MLRPAAALALLAGPALASSGAGQPETAPPVLVHPGDEFLRALYSCADGQTLDVVYVNTASGTSFAIVLEDGALLPMQQALSASGAIYGAEGPGGAYELRTKGNAADLLVTPAGGEETPIKRDCTTP